MLVVLMACFGVAEASAVSVTAAARGFCEGSQHVITVTGMTSVDDFGGLVGVRLDRRAVGICEPAEVVTADPLPLAIVSTTPYWIQFSASVTVASPHDGVKYEYSPHFVHAEGLDVQVQSGCAGNGFVSALIGCDDVPFLRGELVLVDFYDGEWTLRIDACESDCWTEQIHAPIYESDLERYLGTDWRTYVGRIVDVFGDRLSCAMIDQDPHVISRIALAPAGSCGPVPTQRVDWGSVKSLFR